MFYKDTIVALATASGVGAIAVIRISGNKAIEIIGDVFQTNSNKDITKQKSHTIHLGYITDGENILDQVLVSIFRNPNSYTGEDVVEISCHGSIFIQQQIIQLLIAKGCRTAQAGEFTLRAFLNAKMDLSQAEAVADLINSENQATHQIAIQQMRGGFSNEIAKLKNELINFASLIELELDFSEEDVEFADRNQFKKLLDQIEIVLKRLIDSFAVGNVIKNGIPVAIVGEPNVGKSTLLNAFLNEEKAIVSDIAGTTRDAIEDEIIIEGINFRFIDTAGIRKTEDIVENIGIKRTFEKIQQAQAILLLIDKTENIDKQINEIKNKYPQKTIFVVINKIDLFSENEINTIKIPDNISFTTISAKEKIGIETIKDKLLSLVNTNALKNNQTIVANTRHYDSLFKALGEIKKVKSDIQTNISADLIAIDLRQALYYLGEITGEITNEKLLENIFANFCIGK